MAKEQLKVGDLSDISGEVNIATGDIIKGYTAEQVANLLTQIQSTFQPKPFDGRCPYKGLDAFEEEDADLFFGREKLVADLVARVKQSRTVFVTGPSGSGKSSLVRAGLIPALKRGVISDLHSERWLYESMKPGRDPLGELARVAASLAGNLSAGEDIRTKGLKDATVLAQWCEIALKEGRDRRVVLFIDQFEEVFTQAGNGNERNAFLGLLTQAATAENGRVIVLFSMRSDFIPNCATYPQVNALLNQQFVQIGAMQSDELVSAIAQPAMRVGLRIDPALVAQIINDMKGEPGALPLMQFALKDLFDAQQVKGGVNALTLEDYLQRGGIQKSLERHADEAFGRLSAREQELARSIFGGLIEVGRGMQDTRRTALFDELVPAGAKAEEVETLTHKLADARLITTDEQAGEDTLTISHEKLIDAWPWLRKLVNENRDAIALQNEIANDAKEWDDHKRDASYLYAGARLANSREQLDAKKIQLSGTADAFVQAGLAKRRRNQAVLAGGIVAIITLLTLAVVIFSHQSRDNAHLARIALSRELATRASVVTNLDPVLGLLLAREAVNTTYRVDGSYTPEALQQLYTNLQLPIVYGQTHLKHDGKAQVVDTDASGKNLLAIVCDQYSQQNVCIKTSAYIWDESGKLKISFSVSDFAPVQVSMNADGSRFVLIGAEVVDGNTRWRMELWDTSGRLILDVATSDSIWPIAKFNSDGRVIAMTDSDHLLHTYDMNGNLLGDYSIPLELVMSVDFSSDSSRLAIGDLTGDLRIVDLTTGKTLIEKKVFDGLLNSMTYEPKGNRIVTSGCNVLNKEFHCDSYLQRYWTIDSAGLTLDLELEAELPDFNPAGTQFVTVEPVHTDSGVALSAAHLRESDGKEIAVLSGHFIEIAIGARFSPDGEKIAVLGCNAQENLKCAIELWGEDGKFIGQISNVYPTFPKFSRNDTLFAINSEYGQGYQAGLWNIMSNGDMKFVDFSGLVNTAIMAPDGKELVTTACDKVNNITCVEGSFGIWNIDGSLISKIPIPEQAYLAFFSFDSSRILGLTANYNYIFDGRGNLILKITADPKNLANVSPTEDLMFSTTADGVIDIWNLVDGKLIKELKGHQGYINSIRFDSSGSKILSVGQDNTIRIWDVHTGQILHKYAISATSARFATNSQRFLAIRCNQPDSQCANTVAIFDLSGTVLGNLDAQRTSVVGAIFNSTDSNIATDECIETNNSGNCTKGVVRLWKGSGGLIKQLPVLFVGTSWSIFSPNGLQLLTVGCLKRTNISACALSGAYLWDTSGNLISTFSLGSDQIKYAWFNSDGSRITMTGCQKYGQDLIGSFICQKGVAEIWQAFPTVNDMLAVAIARAERSLTNAECYEYLHVNSCP
jgi:WD40 repeat protein